MSADVFLDTNVLVYLLSDSGAPDKLMRSRELIELSKQWEISWQVVQEFCSVAIHRFKEPYPPKVLELILEELLWPHCSVMPSRKLYMNALELQKDTQYRFYDALIVAAAVESGARILYSEDLQHGRRIGPLRILNPYL